MIYRLSKLIRLANLNQKEIDGKWVPARPLSGPGWEPFPHLLRAAWLVLRGKADAVIWPEGQ